MQGRVEASDRDLVRVPGEGAGGDEADQLGLQRLGAERRCPFTGKGPGVQAEPDLSEVPA